MWERRLCRCTDEGRFRLFMVVSGRSGSFVGVEMIITRRERGNSTLSKLRNHVLNNTCYALEGLDPQTHLLHQS